MIAKQKCSKCGYEWIPRTLEPKMCPNCKNRKWGGKNHEWRRG